MVEKTINIDLPYITEGRKLITNEIYICQHKHGFDQDFLKAFTY